MSAPPPLITANSPNVVSTFDCARVDDVIDDDVTINGGLSTLLWLPPTPSDGLGHPGAVVGASDGSTIHYCTALSHYCTHLNTLSTEKLT